MGPMPPPVQNPTTPTSDDEPVTAESPCGAAACSTRDHLTPDPTVTVRAAGSTSQRSSRLVDTTTTPWWVTSEWPVATTPTPIPRARAHRTVAATSSALVAPTTATGSCAAARLKPASSVTTPTSPGSQTGPVTALRRSARSRTSEPTAVVEATGRVVSWAIIALRDRSASLPGEAAHDNGRSSTQSHTRPRFVPVPSPRVSRFGDGGSAARSQRRVRQRRRVEPRGPAVPADVARHVPEPVLGVVLPRRPERDDLLVGPPHEVPPHDDLLAERGPAEQQQAGRHVGVVNELEPLRAGRDVGELRGGGGGDGGGHARAADAH